MSFFFFWFYIACFTRSTTCGCNIDETETQFITSFLNCDGTFLCKDCYIERCRGFCDLNCNENLNIDNLRKPCNCYINNFERCKNIDINPGCREVCATIPDEIIYNTTQTT